MYKPIGRDCAFADLRYNVHILCQINCMAIIPTIAESCKVPKTWAATNTHKQEFESVRLDECSWFCES